MPYKLVAMTAVAPENQPKRVEAVEILSRLSVTLLRLELSTNGYNRLLDNLRRAEQIVNED